MPEFHIGRALLALAELLLAWRIWRGRIGWALGFILYLLVDAGCNAYPYRIHEIDWTRRILMFLRTPLLFLVSFEVLRFLHGITFRVERQMLVAFGALTGVVLVVAGFHWDNPTLFASATTVRQYAICGLAVGYSAFWAYASWIRPVDLPDALKRSHGLLWAIWLWALAVMASTGEGGLARVFVDFRSGQYWRGINSTCLAAELALVAGWFWALRRKREESLC